MKAKPVLWLTTLIIAGLAVFAAGSASLTPAAAAPGMSPPDSLSQLEPPDPSAAALATGEPAIVQPLDDPLPALPAPSPLQPPARPGAPSTLSRPEGEVLAIAAAPPAVAPAVASGGYFYQDSGAPTGPIYGWVEISGTGTLVGPAFWHATGAYEADDEGYATLTLPFAFPYYGHAYHTLYLDANGQLGFSPFGSPTFTGTMGIPATGYPNNRISAFYTDLDLGIVGPGGGGKVWYWHDTTNKRFVVEYKETRRYGGLGPAGSFEVMLYENGDILVQYQSLSVSPSFPAGIENADGSAGLPYGGAVATNSAVGYYRPAIALSVQPAAVMPYGHTAALTATLRGRDWSPVIPPNGTPVGFAAGALGTISPASVASSGGIAGTQFTSGSLCSTAPVTASATLGDAFVQGTARLTTGNGPEYKTGYLAWDDTWPACVSPYVISGTFVISPNVTLRIAEGSLVQFADDAALVVLGRLEAPGTAALPIVFDSTAAQAGPGAYRGIAIGNEVFTGSASFSHVEMAHAGRTHSYADAPYSAAVLAYRASPLDVANSSFHDNQGAALALLNGSTGVITANTLVDNITYGLYVDGAAPTISHNSIAGSTYGVYVNVGASPIVSNNTIAGAQEGLHIQAAGGLVTDNTISGGAYGIVAGASTAALGRNTISNGTAVGIFLEANSTGSVYSNTISNYGSGGLYVRDSSTAITGNVLSSNSGFGAYLLAATSTFAGNTVSGNSPYGIYVKQGAPTLSGNTVSGGGNVGLYVDGATPVAAGNSFTSSGGYGVFMVSSGGTLSSNSINGNGSVGVYLSASNPALNNNVIQGNGVQAASAFGVYALSGSNAVLSGNTIAGNVGSSDGFGLYGSASSLQLTGNIITGNAGLAGDGYGVYLTASPNVTITGGVASSNNGGPGGKAAGVKAVSSSGVISGVTLNDNGLASSWAAGLHLENSTFAVTNGAMSGNNGAGLFANPAAVAVAGATISGNAGNGLHAGAGSALTLTASAVFGNGAGVAGSGVLAVTSTLSASGGSIYNNGGPGLTLQAGSASLNNVTVTVNFSDGIELRGGALALQNSRILTNGGNGLTVQSGVITVTDSTADGNGGAGVVLGSGSLLNGTGLTVTHSTGRGISASGARLSLNGGSISANSAGIELVAGARLTMTNGLVAQNGSSGITATASFVTLTGTQAVTNTNAGVRLDSSTASLSGAVLRGNQYGVWAAGGNLTMDSSALEGNSADGVWLQAGVIAGLTRNTIRYNAGLGVSSGVSGASPAATLRSNSIYGNGSSGLGNAGATTIDARGNWWGTNAPVWTPPAPVDVQGQVNITPWITLKLAPLPGTLSVGALGVISATMNDGAGNAVVDGATVGLTTTLGSIGSLSTFKQTVGGVATATLGAGTIAGSNIITGTSLDRGFTSTLVIIQPGPPYLVTLLPAPPAVAADGVSTSTITATVTDSYGNPVGGVLNFSASSLLTIGASPVTRTLNAGGQASIVARAGTVAGSGYVTATIGSATGSTAIVLTPGLPATVTLLASPTVVAADGVATSALTATVQDTFGNPVSDGSVVAFSASLGAISPFSMTRDNDQPGITYSGSWGFYPTVGAYGGSMRWSLNPGDTASWVFTGTSVALLYATDLGGGIAEVTVDGAYTTTIDMYGSPAVFQLQRSIASGLGAGSHTIAVKVTNLKNPLSTNYWVGVDAFRVGVATSGGVATAGISSAVTGQAYVTATIGGRSDSRTVVFVPGPPFSMTLSASPTTVAADGVAAGLLTATVYDAQGRFVTDTTPVTFTTNLGVLGSSSITKYTSSGVATANITSTQTGLATIGAEAGGVTRTVNITFTPGAPYTVTLAANPPAVRGDGLSTTTVTASVSDLFGNPVADGANVTFATSLGTLAAPLTRSTVGGQASIVLTSTLTISVAHVTGTVGVLVGTLDVPFTAGAPSAMTLVANPATIIANGVSSSVLTATVRDSLGFLVTDGTPVTFTTSLGSVGAPLLVRTTSNGAATAVLTGTVSGHAVVTAQAGTVQTTTAVTLLPGPAALVSLVADPQHLLADSLSTSAITATVRDAFGNLVADGTPVSFAASAGTLAGPLTRNTSAGNAVIPLTAGPALGISYITGTVSAGSGSTWVGFDQRVNAGGPQYTGADGKIWAADQVYVAGGWGHTGGSTYSTAAPITGTLDDTLYQTEHWGMSSYRFTAPAGSYAVTLKFAEIYYNGSGKRVFNVNLEGTTTIASLDVFAAAGGRYIAYDRTFNVNVSDGILNIGFVAISNSVKINAIEVQPLSALPPAGTATPTLTPTATPTSGGPTATRTATATATPTATATGVAPSFSLRVNAGGLNFVDSHGATWQADQAWSAGGWGYVGGAAYSNGAGIAGTTDDGLYQTERWWNGTGSYKVAVPNGSYDVVLRFAEIYQYAREGGRVFDIKIEGAVVHPNLDLIAVAGKFVAYDETYPGIVVSDGILQIDFVSKAGSAKISGIGINAAGGGPPPATSTSTPTATATATYSGGGASLYRVNAGGTSYTDGLGDTWQADQAWSEGGWGYVGGFTYGTGTGIKNTTDDTLYQSERWWNGTGTYKFSVPNGSYDVMLRFAEIYQYAFQGSRVFDVKVEGVVLAPNIDLAGTVGLYAASDIIIPGVSVSDGILQIDLLPKKGSPKISAIKIVEH